GECVQMTSRVKLLRALKLLGGLDAAIPESIELPIAKLEREQRKLRRRARARRSREDDPPPRPWRWGAEAVTLWGSRIAAVSIEAGARYATFQYDPAFVRSGIEIAPLRMALRAQPYSFPGLPQDAFSGLPGLLADS